MRIHTHIGSGSDPLVWQKVAKMSIATVEQFEDVHTLDMGGGFKVARVAGEKSTDLQKIGKPVAKEIRDFAKRTGRKIRFEIEPGLKDAEKLKRFIDHIKFTDRNEQD